MKKLSLLLLFIIFASCTNEKKCDCIKEYYEFETIELENGNLVNSFPELVKKECVEFQEEVYVNTSNNSYYVIVCE